MTINWSTEQQDIFHWFRTSRVRVKPNTDGVATRNLVVRARAGTGKTTTIIEGVEHASEAKILLAAFNKDIATELQSRVKNPRVEAKTLHSLGAKFCFRNWEGIRIDDSGKRALNLAKAACDPDTHDIIVKLVSNIHSKGREINPFAKSGADLVNLASAFNLIPDVEWEDKGWDVNTVCDAAYKAMCYAKVRPEDNGIDFADMIFLPLVNNWVRPWFNMVVVDEAQDMTVAQLTLARRCCKRDGRICVVGDDRQAIYGFRGADSDALDNLKAELNAFELGLTITRRCPKLVVALAQKLVPDFRAADEAPEGVIKECSSDNMILAAKEGDFILSRTNAPLIKCCMALLKRGVRARIKGRDIGRGLLALIRKLAPELPSELDALLEAWADAERERATGKLSEEAAADRIEFINDQVAVLDALADGAATITELEHRINGLFADDVEKGTVMCATVHRAKGLEARNVYLLEGTFRRGRAEEDNIRYVGITRAKEVLTWVKGFERNPKHVAA